MRIDVLTIFPDLVSGFADASLLGKARRDGVLDIRVHDLRSVTTDPHQSVDGAPYGGGAGMVLKPEPIVEPTPTRSTRDEALEARKIG